MNKLLASIALVLCLVAVPATASAATHKVVIKNVSTQTAHSTSGNASNSNSTTIKVTNGGVTTTSSSSQSGTTTTHSCTTTTTVNGVTTVTNC